MKSKWIWLVAIIAAAGAYLFDNNPGTLTALICVVFLPAIGMLPLLFTPKLQVELETPASAEKNQAVRCKLKVSNMRIIPVVGVAVLARCHNLRTGRTEQMNYRFSVLPKQHKTIEFSLQSRHCGLMQVSMELESHGDLFGMQRRKLYDSVQKELMVLPVLFQPQIALSDQGWSIPDSDIYSAEKPGSDPGEIFAIREYVPGDAIRQIHWKLSEKCDKTMVREFGKQIADDMLVLLETSGSDSPEETDAITEIFASVCQALSNDGILFHAGWRAPVTDALYLQTVFSPGDFPEILSQLMRLPPKDAGSVAERFTEQFGRCNFLHIVVIGAQIPSGVQELYNDNKVSVLVPYRDGVIAGLQPDGTYVLPFGKETYAAEFSALEV